MIQSTFALLALTLSLGPAAGAPDQGITSPVHGKHVGEIVFANAEVSFKKPDPRGFKRAFKWPEPIYGRAYLPHSLATEYAKRGWTLPDKPKYVLEVRVTGEVVWTAVKSGRPKWSTLQLGLVPAPQDTYKWAHRFAIPAALATLKAGPNVVDLRVVAVDGKQRSAVLARGGFTLTVDAATLAKAKAAQSALRGFTTSFRAGDDVWKEWKVAVGASGGTLKTTFRAGDDVWKEWRFEGSGGKATIKTTFRAGDDVWKEWRLERGGKKVTLKTRFRAGDDAWKDWVITAGKEQWSAKPRFRSGDDAWKDWVVTGPQGTLELKTRFRTGDDVWKDWVVTDRAPEASADVKLAALFVVLYSGALRHK